METVSATMASRVVEMINWRNADDGMTPTGGALFSPRTRAVSTRGNWHLWVNAYPILNKPSGYLAGGRGDELAVSSGQPQEVFGFWVDAAPPSSRPMSRKRRSRGWRPMAIAGPTRGRRVSKAPPSSTDQT